MQVCDNMKNLPSTGFVYLVAVVFCCGLFFSWIAEMGWYEKVRTAQQTDADIAQWASYLEKTAKEFSNKDKQGEMLKEAAQLRTQLKQFDKAIVNLEKALQLKPHDDSLRSLLLPAYYQTGKQEEAIKLAKENFEVGQRNWGTISVLLEFLAEQTDTDLVLKVVQAIVETDLPEKQALGDSHVLALGLTGDRWTHDGKPGFLVVSKSRVRLKLACYAGPRYTPLTVTIEDQYGENIFSYIFQSPENIEFEFPKIPVGENRLFVVKTDKYWVPPKNDKRRLGVLVRPF